LYNGFFIVVEKLGFKRLLDRNRAASHVYTLVVTIFGIAFFRCETFTYALSYLPAMAGFADGNAMSLSISKYLTRDVLSAAVVGIVFSTPLLPFVQRRLNGAMREKDSVALAVSLQWVRVTGLCIILVFCTMSLAAGTHNPFIYFRF
jgi:alginate O-acetyltransferase complex protein AlgI